MAASLPPLVATSSDGSLVAIHARDPPSSSSSSGGGGGGKTIRCHDGDSPSGALKFTLRVPSLDPSSNDDGGDAAASILARSGGDEGEGLTKLVFSSRSGGAGGAGAGAGGAGGGPGHLCALAPSSASVLVWDLDRGVLSDTIHVRDAGDKKSKKKRKSSVDASGREVLCDVAAGGGGSLYALVFFPSDDGGDGSGKCRVYKYDLSSKKGGAALVQKIKAGSVDEAEGGGSPRFGLAVRGQSMAVRLGNQLRTIDLVSGERLCKADLPEEATAASSGGEGGSAPLVLSSDGKYLAAAEERQVAIFSFDKKGGKNKGKGKGKDKDKGKMQAVAVLSAKEDAPVTHLELCAEDDELSVLAFQSSAGTASLFSVPTEAGDASSLAPQMPQASLRPDDDASLALVHAGFHPRDPANALKLRFRRARAASRGAAGAGTELPSETLSYGDFKGAIVVGKSLEGDDSKKQSKRKAEAKNAALAAGEKGREARGAEDLGQVREEKRARVAEEGGGDAGGGDEEDDDFKDVEGDAEEEGGQTVAERLAMISSAMEATDEESSSSDDEEDDGEDRSAAAPAPTTFKPRSATSESLAALLTQALTSGDPAQLNAALQVTDRRVVEATVRALRDLDVASRRASGPPNASATTTRYVPALTAHVIRRMARKHSLVAPLGVWIRSVLAVTAGGLAEGAEDEGAAREGRDLARGLGPLRSFLEERAEALPDLLRLEGRLALLGRGGR